MNKLIIRGAKALALAAVLPLYFFSCGLSGIFIDDDEPAPKTLIIDKVPKVIEINPQAKTMMENNKTNIKYSQVGSTIGVETEGLVVLTIYVPTNQIHNLIDIKTGTLQSKLTQPKEFMKLADAFSLAEVKSGKVTRPVLWTESTGRELGTYFDIDKQGYYLFFTVMTPCFRYMLEGGMTPTAIANKSKVIDLNAKDVAQGGDIKWLYISSGVNPVGPVEMLPDDNDGFWSALLGLKP